LADNILELVFNKFERLLVISISGYIKILSIESCDIDPLSTSS
jgi:hypothetical protein